MKDTGAIIIKSIEILLDGALMEITFAQEKGDDSWICLVEPKKFFKMFGEALETNRLKAIKENRASK